MGKNRVESGWWGSNPWWEATVTVGNHATTSWRLPNNGEWQSEGWRCSCGASGTLEERSRHDMMLKRIEQAVLRSLPDHE